MIERLSPTKRKSWLEVGDGICQEDSASGKEYRMCGEDRPMPKNHPRNGISHDSTLLWL